LILFASLAKQMLRTKRIFMLFLSFLQHFHMRSQSTIIIKVKWYGISQVWGWQISTIAVPSAVLNLRKTRRGYLQNTQPGNRGSTIEIQRYKDTDTDRGRIRSVAVTGSKAVKLYIQNRGTEHSRSRTEQNGKKDEQRLSWRRSVSKD